MNTVFSTRTLLENPTQYLAIRARNNPARPENWLALAQASKRKLSDAAFAEYQRTSQIKFRSDIGSSKNVSEILNLATKFYIEENVLHAENWAKFAFDIQDNTETRIALMKTICSSRRTCEERFSEIDALFFEPDIQNDLDIIQLYSKLLFESSAPDAAIAKIRNFIKIGKGDSLDWILFDLYLRERDFASAMTPLLALVKKNAKDLRARTFRIVKQLYL